MPVHLVGYLRQEGPTAIAPPDIDTMTMQLKLIQTLYTSHGREHGDFDVDIIQFLFRDGHESRVFKGCGARHLSHYLMQGSILAKVSDATTQSALLMQRYKRAAL